MEQIYQWLPILSQYTSLIPADEKLPPIQIDLKDESKLSILSPHDIECLNKQHFVVKDNIFLNLIDCEQIVKDCSHLFKDESTKAKMGQKDEKWSHSNIRGDHIFWINERNFSIIPTSLMSLVSTINLIRDELNQSCDLGLSKVESHLTCYPGNRSGYIRHLDATKSSHLQRKITCLFYLNSHWTKTDGGELIIYANDEKDIVVEPISYRLLIFQSGCVEHQVLPTNSYRYAFTSWFS